MNILPKVYQEIVTSTAIVSITVILDIHGVLHYNFENDLNLNFNRKCHLVSFVMARKNNGDNEWMGLKVSCNLVPGEASACIHP